MLQQDASHMAGPVSLEARAAMNAVTGNKPALMANMMEAVKKKLGAKPDMTSELASEIVTRMTRLNPSEAEIRKILDAPSARQALHMLRQKEMRRGSAAGTAAGRIAPMLLGG